MHTCTHAESFKKKRGKPLSEPSVLVSAKQGDMASKTAHKTQGLARQWWHTPLVPAVSKQRQMDLSSRPACCSKDLTLVLTKPVGSLTTACTSSYRRGTLSTGTAFTRTALTHRVPVCSGGERIPVQFGVSLSSTGRTSLYGEQSEWSSSVEQISKHVQLSSPSSNTKKRKKFGLPCL